MPHKLILASQSPRRQQLLKDLGYAFEVRLKETDETIPPHLPQGEASVYLAQKKAKTFLPTLQTDEILLTADTIVLLEDQIMNKPADPAEAKEFLRRLSGKKHLVITGFCLTTLHEQIADKDVTEVYFKLLSEPEIEHYVSHYNPYDKAGGYGAQDWIGLIGVEKIVGSYFNVMGLPVHKVYQALSKFGRFSTV